MKIIILITILFLTPKLWSQTILSVDYDNSTFCDNETKTFKIKTVYQTGQTYSIDLNINSNSTFLSVFNSTGPFDVTTDGLNDTAYFYLDVNLYSMGSIADNSVYAGDFFDINLLNNFGLSVNTYQITGLNLYGLVFPTFDLSGVNICSNGLPFDLETVANTNPSGGVFLWGNEETNIFNPSDLYDTGASLIAYEYTNSDGCSGQSTYSIPFKIPATVTATVVQTTTCNSANAELNAYAVSGNPPYSVSWSTGFNESIAVNGLVSTVSNLPSGTYYANFVDNNSCITTATVHVSDTDINVTETISPKTCHNTNDGEILLNISPPGGSTFTSFWSNGITTQNMTNSNAGEYSVEIHTDNNCNFFETYEIPDSSIYFTLESIGNYSCPGSLFGNIDVSVEGGIGGLNVVWTSDVGNSITQSNEDLINANAGVYTCTITDNNGCSKAWDATIDAYSNITLDVNQITKEDCGQNNGSIDIDIYSGSASANYWQWSNGATTEDLINVPAGNYTLEYQDDNNCAGFLTVTIPNVKPYQPSICLLTVDTTLTYNTIIWEKDPGFVVDGWNVYRETTIYGQFELVATIPYADDAMFIDNAASPVDRSWRYYITSFNGCEESYPSFVHKTIHTVSFPNTDGSGGVDVVWDDYEGINYSSISLMKHSIIDGWVEIPNVTSPYNDQTPGLDYFVKFNLAQSCNPTKAIDHNSSRSNRSSTAFAPGNETGLTVVENEEGKIVMYPNPTNSILNVFIENSDNYNYFTIVDMQGNLIYKQNIYQSNNEVTTLDFATGVYFVQIYSQNNVVTQKIIKQ